MTSMFRIATKEAVREIITEAGHENRFGLVLTVADIDVATEKIVDLMETAINLRAHGRGKLEQLLAGTATQQQEAPTGRLGKPAGNAAPVTSPITNSRPEASKSGVLNWRLPRTRIALSEDERSRLQRE